MAVNGGRTIGLLGAVGIGVGAIVGAGYFIGVLLTDCCPGFRVCNTNGPALTGPPSGSR